MNQDAQSIPDLTDRQLYILSAVIRVYTEHPEPVSSRQIADDPDLGVSSATVRNELGILEQMGLIASPHTSAGRVPTEKGYRYFVKNLLQTRRLSPIEKNSIRYEIEKTGRGNTRKLLQAAASVLAQRTKSAALVTEPRAQGTRIKHVELISVHGYMVLMILVLEGGQIIQQMLTLAAVVDQERLTEVTAIINRACTGEQLEKVRQKAHGIPDVLAREVMELIADVLEDAQDSEGFVVHTYGFSQLLPEMPDSTGVQQAIRLMEQKSLIRGVLAETIQKTNEPVQVIVGGDDRFENINRLSMVIGRYGTSKLVGAISVLGPTRMRYGQAISTVRYVSTLMSDMLKNAYDPEEQEK